MKHVTIKDIAKKLLLSKSTVSRALADDKNIRKETKEKVLEAAAELGYRANAMARNLRSGFSNTVGVIVPEMVTPYAAAIIEGIQSYLYPKGLKVIMANSHEDSVRELDNLEMMERFRVDGIIISLSDSKRNVDKIRQLIDGGIPVVCVDRIPDGIEVPQVIVDDYMKSFFLMERIIRSGRSKIAHIIGPDHIHNSHERMRGFKDALLKFRLPFREEAVIRAGLSYDDGAKAADRLIDSGVEFDAVFAFTDIQAIGVMNRLRERGKKIPEEVAVASFSGTELSEMSYPRMTTVAPPLHKMGAAAAELMLERIRNDSAPCRSIVLDAEIIMRESTGC